MRVLIVGGGGREHALAWGVSRSPDCDALFCAPGNAGTALLLRETGLGGNLPVGAEDVPGVVAAARAQAIDFVIVGPEAPLAAGMADALCAAGDPRLRAEPGGGGTRIVEVVRQADSCARPGRPTPPARPSTTPRPPTPSSTARSRPMAPSPSSRPTVLAAGKGVIVPASMAEAHAAVDDLLGGRFGAASATVVVEERLTGMEASAMALVDGETVLPLPLSCDYKRALDGDRGPNTGGMGVYSPPGFLGSGAWPRLLDSIHRPVARRMRESGRPYRGLLYGGLMVDDAGAARVIEFNCRFGDPEVQVLAPQLRSDLLALLLACAEGRLEGARPEWSGEAAVGVVLASGGYPGAYETGHRIAGLDAVDPGVLVFHAGTALDAGRRRRHQRGARAYRRGARPRSGDGAGAGIR